MGKYASEVIEMTLREIIARGNNAEVRSDKSGNLVVYEVEKKKRLVANDTNKEGSQNGL